ncbi:hypothetical protein RCL1_006479 [Eukaryota sp. TZLM3-RCL]
MHNDSPLKARARSEFHNIRKLLKDRCYSCSRNSPFLALDEFQQLLSEVNLPTHPSFFQLVEHHCLVPDTSIIDLKLFFSGFSFKHKNGSIVYLVFVPCSSLSTPTTSSFKSVRPQSAPSTCATNPNPNPKFNYSKTFAHPFAFDCDDTQSECIKRREVYEKISKVKSILATFDPTSSGHVTIDDVTTTLDSVRVRVPMNELIDFIRDCLILKSDGNEYVDLSAFFKKLPTFDELFDTSCNSFPLFQYFLIPYSNATDQYCSGFINENFNPNKFRTIVRRPQSVLEFACTRNFSTPETINQKTFQARTRNPLLCSIELGKSRSFIQKTPTNIAFGHSYPARTETFSEIVCNQFAFHPSSLRETSSRKMNKTFGSSKSNRTFELRKSFIQSRARA